MNLILKEFVKQQKMHSISTGSHKMRKGHGITLSGTRAIINGYYHTYIYINRVKSFLQENFGCSIQFAIPGARKRLKRTSLFSFSLQLIPQQM